MCWAWIKDYVKKRNTFNLKDVENLFQEAVRNFTPDMWHKYVRHTRKVVEAAWEQKGLMEESVERFVISLGGTADSSDEDSEEELDDDGDDVTSAMSWALDCEDLGVAPLPAE